MKPYFLDTGYLLALELKNDQNHTLAKQHWQARLQARAKFVTTSYVFDETVTFLNSRGHHAKAVQLGNRLLPAPRSSSFMLTKCSLRQAGPTLSSIETKVTP